MRDAVPGPPRPFAREEGETGILWSPATDHCGAAVAVNVRLPAPTDGLAIRTLGAEA